MGGNIGGVILLYDAQTIVDQTSYWSQSVDVRNANVVGVWYKATSAGGAPDLLIEIEQSYTRPTTEKATDSNWVEPQNMADIETNLVVEVARVKSATLTPMSFARIKVTGNVGNPADTVLTLYLFIQEGL